MWLPKSRVLNIALSAKQVSLVKTGYLWSRAPSICRTVTLPQSDDAAPWRPAISALANMLSEPGASKSSVNIVLSGRFVRWQLLPSRPELTRSSELMTYAALRFAETFGKAADTWQVLPSFQPPGKSMPACAIDVALMEALSSTCKAAGASLASVTPYFACAFDHWRGVVNSKSGWFGLIESDCLSLGLLQGGNWLGLRMQRLDADWRDVLPGMMAQIGIAAELAEASVPLYLVGDGDSPVPIPGLPFEWLQPKAVQQRAMVGCRMAFGV